MQTMLGSGGACGIELAKAQTQLVLVKSEDLADFVMFHLCETLESRKKHQLFVVLVLGILGECRLDF